LTCRSRASRNPAIIPESPDAGGTLFCVGVFTLVWLCLWGTRRGPEYRAAQGCRVLARS
jgi:hypothetical protein